MSQSCGKCRTPCGAIHKRSVRIWRGRWCARCWARIGERKWIKWHTKRGHVRLDFVHFIAWRVPA